MPVGSPSAVVMGLTSSSPSRACLARLVPSSDAIKAACPARSSEKPRRDASQSTSRRPSATCEASVTGRAAVTFIASG